MPLNDMLLLERESQEDQRTIAPRIAHKNEDSCSLDSDEETSNPFRGYTDYTLAIAGLVDLGRYIRHKAREFSDSIGLLFNLIRYS